MTWGDLLGSCSGVDSTHCVAEELWGHSDLRKLQAQIIHNKNFPTQKLTSKKLCQEIAQSTAYHEFLSSAIAPLLSKQASTQRKKLGVIVCTCNSSTREVETEVIPGAYLPASHLSWICESQVLARDPVSKWKQRLPRNSSQGWPLASTDVCTCTHALELTEKGNPEINTC